MDMFFFFLPFIILGAIAIIGVATPLSIWLSRALLSRKNRPASTFEDTL